MSREYQYLIDVAVGDPIQVKRYSPAPAGVQFSQDGVTTVIPWAQITRIRWADAAELGRCADPEDPADEVSDAVKAFYAELDTARVDLGAAVPRSEDTAPEGGRTPGEMSPAPDGPTADRPDTNDPDPKTGAGRARESGGDPSDAEVRAWAKSKGMDVPGSGPLKDSVRKAYAAEHTN